MAVRRRLGYRRCVRGAVRGTGTAGALARLRDRDVVAAAVLAVLALVQVLVVLPIASPAVGIVVALGSTVPVAFRRRHPIASALVGSAVWLIPTDGFLLIGYVAAFLLYYAVTAYTTSQYVAAATVLIGVLISVAVAAVDHLPIGEYVGGVLAVVAPAGVGVLVRRQRERNRQLEEFAQYLEQERDRRERAAIADERARIARELHDIIAHALSVVAVQADAASAAIESKPQLAQAPLAAIRTSAHQALIEMRRLLGVLRAEPGEPDLAPLPGIAELPVLLDTAAAAGVTAQLSVEGRPVPLPRSADLTSYRIVQEALTNAAKHAAGADVRITLRWEHDLLDIRVRDFGPGPAGPASPDAHGLVGMRERVRIQGGHFAAGAASGGGFEVHATVPIERP
jgi:signal transduction histidine kinase